MDTLWKTCSKCEETKPVDDYSRDTRTNRPVNPCKACKTSEQRKRYAAYEDKRSGGLIKNYGITLVDYNMMWFKQGGTCFICQLPERALRKGAKEPRSLSVDHNHETGKVRHLLCSRCNFVVGHIEKSGAQVVLRAIRYIEEHNNNIYDEEE